MGCDGIWEKETANTDNNNQVKWNIAEKSLKDIIADNIFDRLVARKEDAYEGTDNMTCIIIKLKEN